MERLVPEPRYSRKAPSGWGKTAMVLGTVAVCFSIFVGVYAAETNRLQQPVPTGPFRPRPRPPEPPQPPAPEPDTSDLDVRERRLFDRVRKFMDEREARIEERVERRANRAMQAELSAAVEALDAVDANGEVQLSFAEGEPVQGMMGAMLASKIAQVAKKIAYFVLMTLIGGAILAFFVKFWMWIVPGFVAAVSVVFWGNRTVANAIGSEKK